MWLPQPGCRGLVVNARCLAGYPVDKRFLDRDDLLPAFAAELQVLGENKGMVCGTRQNAVKTFLYRLHELGKLDTDLHRVFERVDSGCVRGRSGRRRVARKRRRARLRHLRAVRRAGRAAPLPFAAQAREGPRRSTCLHSREQEPFDVPFRLLGSRPPPVPLDWGQHNPSSRGPRTTSVLQVRGSGIFRDGHQTKEMPTATARRPPDMASRAARNAELRTTGCRTVRTAASAGLPRMVLSGSRCMWRSARMQWRELYPLRWRTPPQRRPQIRNTTPGCRSRRP